MNSEFEPTPLTLETLRATVSGTFFTEALRGEVLACADGRAELTAPIGPDILQYAGAAYGGVVAFLADVVGVWACASIIGLNVSSQMNIHFLAPAVGERLIGRGSVIRAGRTISVAQSEIYVIRNGQESLVATATVTAVPASPKRL